MQEKTINIMLSIYLRLAIAVSPHMVIMVASMFQDTHHFWGLFVITAITRLPIPQTVIVLNNATLMR